MPTIVGILTFMSRINFIVSRVEHEKKLYNLGARFSVFINYIYFVRWGGFCDAVLLYLHKS